MCLFVALPCSNVVCCFQDSSGCTTYYGVEGNILSPNFPGYNYENEVCNQTIVGPGYGEITLTFNSFDVGLQIDPPYDTGCYYYGSLKVNISVLVVVLYFI